MVFDGTPMPRRQSCLLVWLITIVACDLVTATGTGCQGMVFALLGMPMLALSMKPRYMQGYIKATGFILGFYAVLLIIELATGFNAPNPAMQYRFFALTGAWGFLKASTWPVLDPNNAALIINCGLIPCFWLALTSRKKWWLAVLLFTAALICTSSKAGICTAVLVCGLLALYQSEERIWLGSMLLSGTAAILLALTRLPMNDIITAMHQRLEIWQGAFKMVSIESFWGLGMGMFPAYYQRFTIEHTSSQTWAHNDLLQIGIEMGPLAAIAFISVFFNLYRTTTKNNIAAAAMVTAVVAQSMVEFQFYVPVVSLLAGLAMAYHAAAPQRKLGANEYAGQMLEI